MLFRRSFLPTLAFIAAVTAVPSVTPASQCAVGALQCCAELVEPSQDIGIIEALLELVGSTVNGLVGFTCSPSSGVCDTGNLACCTQNNLMDSMMSLGCQPAVL